MRPKNCEGSSGRQVFWAAVASGRPLRRVGAVLAALGPHLRVVIIAIAPPCAWLGGVLRLRQLEAKR
jgi:hypothetical protein